MPQGWVPGPILFNTFNDGLDDATECVLSKFANVKLEGVGDAQDGFAVLLKHPNFDEKWASKNVVKFNWKCQVLSHGISKAKITHPS